AAARAHRGHRGGGPGLPGPAHRHHRRTGEAALDVPGGEPRRRVLTALTPVAASAPPTTTAAVRHPPGRPLPYAPKGHHHGRRPRTRRAVGGLPPRGEHDLRGTRR